METILIFMILHLPIHENLFIYPDLFVLSSNKFYNFVIFFITIFMHILLHLFRGNSFCCYHEWIFFLYYISYLLFYGIRESYWFFKCLFYIQLLCFYTLITVSRNSADSLSALITCPDFPKQRYKLQITTFLVLSIVLLPFVIAQLSASSEM